MDTEKLFEPVQIGDLVVQLSTTDYSKHGPVYVVVEVHKYTVDLVLYQSDEISPILKNVKISKTMPVKFETEI